MPYQDPNFLPSRATWEEILKGLPPEVRAEIIRGLPKQDNTIYPLGTRTQIPPFTAEGSSNPAEKALHPSTIQQILEGLLGGFVGFAGGYQGGRGGGNPLLGYDLLNQIQEKRTADVQNSILNQILGQGMQLGNTPETQQMNIPAIGMGQMGQTLPASVETPNPDFQNKLAQILRGTEQFARLGGSPDVLVNVLTKTGVMQTPAERLAAMKATADLKEADLNRKQKEAQFNQTIALKKQVEERQTQKDKLAERLGNSLIAYRQYLRDPASKTLSPKDADGILGDIQAELRLAQKDYQDALDNYPLNKQYNPNLQPPVAPTLESVADNRGYGTEDLQKLQALAKTGLGGKQSIVKPNPEKVDPNQTKVNALYAKLVAGKLSEAEKPIYRKLREKYTPAGLKK